MIKEFSVGKLYRKGNNIVQFIGKKWYPENAYKFPNTTPVYMFQFAEEPMKTKCGQFSLTMCELSTLTEV